MLEQYVLEEFTILACITPTRLIKEPAI